jgi:hypothetical protein
MADMIYLNLEEELGWFLLMGIIIAGSNSITQQTKWPNLHYLYFVEQNK